MQLLRPICRSYVVKELAHTPDAQPKSENSLPVEKRRGPLQSFTGDHQISSMAQLELVSDGEFDEELGFPISYGKYNAKRAPVFLIPARAKKCQYLPAPLSAMIAGAACMTR
jgi:hypothetical protein